MHLMRHPSYCEMRQSQPPWDSTTSKEDRTRYGFKIRKQQQKTNQKKPQTVLKYKNCFNNPLVKLSPSRKIWANGDLCWGFQNDESR